MRTLLAAVVVMLASTAPAAQGPPPLFEPRAGLRTEDARLDSGAGARPRVVARQRVGLRLAALFHPQGRPAERVALNVAGTTWIATLVRHERDALGFRSWIGTIEGVPESHVVFTERGGIVSGLIDSGTSTYQLRTETPGQYQLERVESRDAPHPHDVSASGAPWREDALADPAAAPDDASEIDVLMLYTPAARAQLGGAAQSAALASQIISDTNTALARSGVRARVRLAGAAELPLVEAPSMASDLDALLASDAAHTLRDAARADLVQLLVSSPDLSSCGVAQQLYSTVGASSGAAFSVADVACTAQYTPTHEMAHNMGAHHAPDDQVPATLLPYAYGYKDPQGRFRTIMAYACPGVPCPRILQFSNPRLTYEGLPTGTPLQDNARAIDEAAFLVANFRRRAASRDTARAMTAPIGLHARVSGSTVHVSWSPGADDAHASYVLQVGSQPGAADLFTVMMGRATSASGTVGAGTYYWRVLAVEASGGTAVSQEAAFTVGASCTPPPPPRNVAAAVDGRVVSLTWAGVPSSGPSVTYVVEAGRSPGTADVAVADVGGIHALTTSAPPGTYFVRVRARTPCGSSGTSDEIAVTVQ